MIIQIVFRYNILFYTIGNVTVFNTLLCFLLNLFLYTSLSLYYVNQANS